MREELVKLRSLPKRTQVIDIHDPMAEALLPNDIRPEKVVSIISDRAPLMMGTTSAFIQLFTTEAKHQVIQFHCIIHQEALCVKDSSKKLQEIF